MKQVIILSGVSGSGKSTYAKKFAQKETFVHYQYTIVSADNYFMKDGVYNFDGSKLGEAHGQCFNKYIGAIQHPDCFELVIVDNTNLTSEEIAPYVLGAQAYGWDCKIVTIELDPNFPELMECVDRNVHGVPYLSIAKQREKLMDRKLPHWWNQEVIPFQE